MDHKKITFYEIRNQKKFSILDNMTLAKKKNSLFSELSSKNETNIDRKINKIFNYLLKHYTKLPQEK